MFTDRDVEEQAAGLESDSSVLKQLQDQTKEETDQIIKLQDWSRLWAVWTQQVSLTLTS